MKGYYKNWYQHYLKLEAEKQKEIQRGYYSNLAAKATEAGVVPAGMPETSVGELERLIIPDKKTGKRKKRFRILNLFMPTVIVFGFLFLWYQLDLGPIRQFTNNSLVFVGLRDETVNVISYHVALLDQHLEFADRLALYINGEHELSFEDLDNLYDEIRLKHGHILEISPNDAPVNRLWDFKIASLKQMLNELIIDEDIVTAHAQFTADQQEIATMIRSELDLCDEYCWHS